MLISVVVPFHNVERYIGACLDALTSVDYPRDRYELIFIDNNSTDSSAEIVRRHPGVRLLSEMSPGAYAARNRGVAASRGDVIAFTDSDCAPRGDWLSQIGAAMAAPDVQLIQGSCGFAGASWALSVLNDYDSAKASYVLSSGIPQLYYAYTNNMAVRRTVIDRVGPFEELMRGADTIFMHRVIREFSCKGIQYRPEVHVRHLEMISAWTWFQKMQIYGKSLQRYSQYVDSRPLSAADRVRVFRATVRDNRYSLPKAMAFFGLLSVGTVFYEVGRRMPGAR